MKEEISGWFADLQDRICGALEAADGPGRFREDAWERPGGGGGRSRVLTEGGIIEKGGVNFSAVWGATPEPLRRARGLEAGDFFATGVSIVLHPRNPHVPIIHMNVRYFEMSTGGRWFGGGIDLTPHYVVPDDARRFHAHLKDVCDRHDADYYPRFKTWADEYFYVRHRQETRGVGGIFFDHLSPTDEADADRRFAFVRDVGEAFAPLYTERMERFGSLPYGDAEREWQRLRRGRYVEFNLVYDRGTRFGLETDGRTESILMSLPPLAGWTYDHQPGPGSREAETLRLLRPGVDWLADIPKPQ
ncbi:MAG: oxygen-dependent coproporphyrinogen oxidase [Catalinimonas sp.]